MGTGAIQPTSLSLIASTNGAFNGALEQHMASHAYRVIDAKSQANRASWVKPPRVRLKGGIGSRMRLTRGSEAAAEGEADDSVLTSKALVPNSRKLEAPQNQRVPHEIRPVTGAKS